MHRRSLLAVFAHPDDETFSMGGTLAAYVAAGTHVALICATAGERGDISDPALATPETLGLVRAHELRGAARALGISELHMLGYRDSGMAGTPNTDACALVNAPADSVVRQIVRIMREVRPHVVVTFDPQGGYGHPDHVAIHQHTVTAFHAAGDPTRYPDQGDPWQAMRLFYSVVPRAHLHALAEVVPPLFDAFERRAWPDEDVHVTQDVAATIPAKQAALYCHRTQVGPDHPLLHIPDASRGAILRYEHFALASPQPDAALRLADLFDGVEIPEPFGVH